MSGRHLHNDVVCGGTVLYYIMMSVFSIVFFLYNTNIFVLYCNMQLGVIFFHWATSHILIKCDLEMTAELDQHPSHRK